ncbi:MAG: hypothetical protein APR53_02565 [Methanoculleus sp. SDB]|nr:MAG: hypothetical protein APR53_02565 [Methanoculleus sp. SDB]
MAFAWQKPAGVFSNGPIMSFSEPVQGVLKDCHFIAALSSHAWTSLMRPSLCGNDGECNLYSFSFYPYSPDSPYRSPAQNVEVSERVWLNDSQYWGARSSDPQEYWPAVYEKAYAAFRLEQNTDTPDMNVLNTTGNPVISLVHLLGKTPVFVTNAGLSADAVFGKILQKTRGFKTTLPMAAWTYESENQAPAPVTYDTDALVANHSYSILGIFNPPTGGHYIVLRNTFGTGAEEPDDGIAHGVWKYEGNPAGINLDIADGIFALEKTLFHDYFEAFGYVGLH